jgi:hypothetical protein
MAQRKPSSPANKSAAKKPVAHTSAARKPPPRKPGRSIVNQKQTPWGLIASVIAVVLFAAAVVTVVITTHKSGGGGIGANGVDPSNPYRQPELAAAKSIKGLTYRVEPDHLHVPGPIKYDSSPPVGGNHSQFWADCDGTVYPQPIANENAVHMLEHGAVWITYRQGLPAAQVDVLKKFVVGGQYIAMSPYPGLKTAVSLQAWGYQLFVNSVHDPRIAQFISVLDHNRAITPEYGASCAQPTFKAHPSTFGHPLWVPVAGTPNTMSSTASTP